MLEISLCMGKDFTAMTWMKFTVNNDPALISISETRKKKGVEIKDCKERQT